MKVQLTNGKIYIVREEDGTYINTRNEEQTFSKGQVFRTIEEAEKEEEKAETKKTDK